MNHCKRAFHQGWSAAPWCARLAALLLMLLVAGCIPDPTAPDDAPVTIPAATGVIVVNEGLWRQDNSTLTFYDPATGTALQDYFTLSNPGLRLGDVGNCVVGWQGRGYIAVTTSRTVEVIEMRTGRSLGRVRLPGNAEPRSVVIADSATAYVGCLNDTVYEFNPITLVLGRAFPTGPAPEAVAFVGGRLVAANSGYGIYRQGEPKAGTLSLIDPASGREERLVPIGPNPRQLRLLRANGKLYVLHGLPQSPGGLVELDSATFQEKRRWPVESVLDVAIDAERGKAYVIGKEGVTSIDLSSGSQNTELLVKGSDWPGRIFYAIGVEPASGRIYIATVTQYTAPGEALIFDREGNLSGRFPTGINPGDLGFY